MAQTPNPTQAFNDWLGYQQSMMEKMTAVMTGATPQNLPDMGLQTQAKALSDAWTTQTQRANDAIAQMTQAWTTAAGGAGQGTPTWPAMPTLMDPAMMDKVKAMFSQFGVGLPDFGKAGAGGAFPGTFPSVADAMLERLTKAPAFAHLRDLDKKLVGLMAAWTKLHTANLAYRTLVAKAWTGVQQAAFQKAGQNAMNLKAPAALDWSESADTWLADLNTALTDLMRTPDYGKSQKQLVDAGNEVRDQLRKLGNEMTDWFELPARDEVDDLAKSVTDMRKQLRLMAKGGAAAAEPAPAKPAARRGAKR